jgi:hypothetical protein
MRGENGDNGAGGDGAEAIVRSALGRGIGSGLEAVDERIRGGGRVGSAALRFAEHAAELLHTRGQRFRRVVESGLYALTGLGEFLGSAI